MYSVVALAGPLRLCHRKLLRPSADPQPHAEFAECGIPQDKGEWLRSQAQAAVHDGGAGGVGSGVGAAGIPEGVPKEDDGV